MFYDILFIRFMLFAFILEFVCSTDWGVFTVVAKNLLRLELLKHTALWHSSHNIIPLGIYSSLRTEKLLGALSNYIVVWKEDPLFIFSVLSKRITYDLSIEEHKEKNTRDYTQHCHYTCRSSFSNHSVAMRKHWILASGTNEFIFPDILTRWVTMRNELKKQSYQFIDSYVQEHISHTFTKIMVVLPMMKNIFCRPK